MQEKNYLYLAVLRIFDFQLSNVPYSFVKRGKEGDIAWCGIVRKMNDLDNNLFVASGKNLIKNRVLETWR